jgi:adenosylhomocysteinase
VALRAKGMGSHTIVTEVNPIRALEAVMDGHRVMPMQQASKIGDIFITLTGGMKAVSQDHLKTMKDGAIIANSGHFNVEIDIDALKNMSSSHKKAREFVDEYLTKDGRHIYLLGEGRLINLTAAEGHPSAVMDMSFANQALSVEYISQHSKVLKPQVYPVPRNIDDEVGRLKLKAMGTTIDILTTEQRNYLESWDIGT